MTEMREAFKGIYGHYPIEGESFIWEGFKDGWQARLEHIKSQGAVAWINKVGDYVEPARKDTVYGSHTIPLYKLPEDES